MYRAPETMRFKNPTAHTLNLEAVGIEEVGPGCEVDIPLTLCAPGRGDGGQRKPSPIETIAPQLVPADPNDHKHWKKVPPPPEPISRIVSVNNNKPPAEPPGVKALRLQLEAKKAAQEAKASPQANVSVQGKKE